MSITLSDVIDNLGVGLCQVRLVCIAGGIYAIGGEVLFLFSTLPGAIASELDLDPYERASLGSVVFIGVLIGNVACCANDYLGRRLPILGAMLGMLLFSWSSVFATSFHAFLLLWGLTGISYGVGVPTWNALCAETTPTSWRFVLNGISMLAFPLGSLFGAFLVYLYAPDFTSVHEQWRTILAMGRIPNIIFFALGVFPGFVESAHFLAERGRLQEAKDSLVQMQHQNAREEVSLDFVPQQKLEKSPAFAPDILFSTTLWQTTSVLCLTTFMLNFMGFGSMYSLPHILQSVDLGMSPALSIVVATFAEVLGYSLGLLLERISGRRQILLFYLASSVVLTSIFIYGVVTLEANGASASGRRLVLIGINGNRLIGAIGWMTAYVCIGEAFPTFARASASGVCIGFGRLGSLSAPWVFEHLLLTTGTYLWYFAFTCLGCLINMMLVFSVLHETKDLTLDELEPLRRSSSH
mmetsp:Transcript_52727/g.83685  ORF Transcript_52727/g.83685 Transcript_52727/m.83685 type:complete len:467 (+) Transcript_52727:44-1444(+)